MGLEELCQKAKAAKADLIRLSTEDKNKALAKVADSIITGKDYILMENAKDILAASNSGMSVALIDRLRLSDDRIEQMANGIRQIIDLPDPVGVTLETFDRPNGLHIEKCSVPLGVVGIIYESRPNVTADAFGLTFKASNVVILKGGSDAIHSNIAITKCIKDGLRDCGITEDAISLIEDTNRETTTRFMKMKEYVDVLIPRGGQGLIRAVVENSSIPVIETGSGNCHLYIDEYADTKKAVDIAINGKTQRIGVCNALESLVCHESVVKTILPEIAKALRDRNVTLRGDEKAIDAIDCDLATDEDYYTEYLDLIMSIKTVNSIDEAISHINAHSTGHSECIISENQDRINQFLSEVDSACVYANASTRFTDGFEFGFGAEIGISTQMLHARGPMGLRELTTYKYKISGNGQVRN